MCFMPAKLAKMSISEMRPPTSLRASHMVYGVTMMLISVFEKYSCTNS